MNDLEPPTLAPVPATAGAVNEVAAFRELILRKLRYRVGKNPAAASQYDWYMATALATRDRVTDRWMGATHAIYETGRKRVYYLSVEFLIGRLLGDTLGNLGLTQIAHDALEELGLDLDRLRALEPDAALGNGGLGRLAACFMESMATLSVAAVGYGIRYEHGLFQQVIQGGWQHEVPENWLRYGNPWEFHRPEVAYTIGFGGTVDVVHAAGEPERLVWTPGETVTAVAYDTPITGWRGVHVNTLRLWSARADDPLQLEEFNRGDHVGAVADRSRLEAISRVLYPSDATPAGQELRLRQEFFFASASLQDLVRRQLAQHGVIETLAEHNAIQLNDTHPAIAVAELMRLLVDNYHLSWAEAWTITSQTFGYTNHTLLPEALESWPVALLERLLPRHMQIIYQINAQHLDAARAGKQADDAFLASVSLIDEQHGRRVRMGHLAFIGARRVNGVSALHTDLMRQTVFRDLNSVYPNRIVNKTNGITFRRWLYQANPRLTALLVEAAGPGLLDHEDALAEVAKLADDAAFQGRIQQIRRENKVALARLIASRIDVTVDPDAMFDVQIKRIHEYKRQLLNILETIALYNAIRAHPERPWAPRVKIFAGKAAGSYHAAKLIIKLANDVARVVNGDPTVRGLLKVAFLPNYNVSMAEVIIPAADLSEQISTAGMEASGTGNMKLALNGALTIGTLDGANVEIREHVGADNIFIFGLTAEQVEARRRAGIDARGTIAGSPVLEEVLEAIRGGVFSPGERTRYHGLVEALGYHDHFLVTTDFDAYFEAQRRVDATWHDHAAWLRMSILNTARVGWFSSDRTIREYADEIWRAPYGPIK